MLSQYGDYFYLYILLLVTVPAIILGILEKKSKYYSIVVTIFMVILTVGVDSQLRSIVVFLILQIVLINIFLRIKSKNKIVFRSFVFLSLLPLIVSKVSPFFKLDLIAFIGISYMSFKTVQIIIEIYDGNIKEIQLFDTLYFILFFPTLSSGPIDRYRRFMDDINNPISRTEYLEKYLYKGIYKLLQGMMYKFAIAAVLYIIMNNIPDDKSLLSLMMYMYVYTLYLFFDFAGYSSMAIGTGYLYGVKVPENFDKPFLSKDMKEFWTRWHISLSRWFGEYIFSRYVLNTLRKRKYKNKKNVYRVGQLITMTTMGIWHGLTWYYIVYGLYQAIALIMTDNYLATKFHKKHSKEKTYVVLQTVITFHIICFGMLIFSGYLNNYL